MERILITLEPDQVTALNARARMLRVPRAAVIRWAIDAYLAAVPEGASTGPDAATSRPEEVAADVAA